MKMEPSEQDKAIKDASEDFKESCEKLNIPVSQRTAMIAASYFYGYYRKGRD